jgi:hypothetical protein
MSSNIDFDRLFARAQQQDVKDGLLKLTQDAVERGAFGSPTFFVGKEMFFGKAARRGRGDRRRQSAGGKGARTSTSLKA